MPQKLKAGLYSLLLLFSCLIILPLWYVREQSQDAKEEFIGMTNLYFPELGQDTAGQPTPTPPEVQKPVSRPDQTQEQTSAEQENAPETETAETPQTQPEKQNGESADADSAPEVSQPADEGPHTFEGSYVFSTVDESYFADALFIGDSRTVGLSEYGRLSGATYFADVGMSCYSVFQTTVNVPGVGNTDLASLLASRSFGKIYLMLGINELGYAYENTVRQYTAVVQQLRAAAPQALLILEGNLHVSAAKDAEGTYINNAGINYLNAAFASLADNQRVFYIDVNVLFDDENGALRKDATGDGVHPYGTGYAEWSQWLMTRGVVAAPEELPSADTPPDDTEIPAEEPATEVLPEQTPAEEPTQPKAPEEQMPAPEEQPTTNTAPEQPDPEQPPAEPETAAPNEQENANASA